MKQAQFVVLLVSALTACGSFGGHISAENPGASAELGDAELGSAKVVVSFTVADASEVQDLRALRSNALGIGPNTIGPVLLKVVSESGATTTSELSLVAGRYEVELKNLRVGNYTFRATAFSIDGTTELFRGEAPVQVLPRQMSVVALMLQQVTPAQTVSNVAPNISSILVSEAAPYFGQTIAVSMVATDPNSGDVLSYEWEAACGQAQTTLSAPTGAATEIQSTCSGDMTIVARVADQHGAQSAMSMVVTYATQGTTVSVSLNSWPDIKSITSPDAQVEPGGDIELVAAAKDDDGDVLAFEWASDCGGTYSHGDTLMPTFHATNVTTANGACKLTLTVSDSRGGETRGEITVWVQQASQTVDPNAPRKVIDFGTHPVTLATFAYAPGAALTPDPRDAVTISYSAGAHNQFTGAKVEGEWDLSDSEVIMLDVGFDEPSGLTGVKVMFCFDNGTGFTNYASRVNLYMPGILKPGRVAIPLLKSEMAVVGTANWAAVRRVEVRLIRIDAAYGTVGANEAQVYGLWTGVSAKPKVLITLDDGDGSLYSAAFPIMRAAGMSGTSYLVGSYVGTPNNVSLDQVREMYAAGWDIANHTWAHKSLTMRGRITRAGSTATFSGIDAGDAHGLAVGAAVVISGADQAEYNGTFTVASVPARHSFTFTVSGSPREQATGIISVAATSNEAIRAAYLDHENWLREHGFARGAGHLAYPKGEWDANVLSVLVAAGLKTGRVAGPEGFAFCPTALGLLDPYRLPVYGVAAQPAVTVLAAVDAAVANRSDQILMVHKVSSAAGATPVTEFQALIDGLAARRDAGLLEVVTISEWHDRL